MKNYSAEVKNGRNIKITPDFIPHAKFHKGTWLLPLNNPYWYYFREKENANRISDRNFIESVDEPLKELVKFLHRRRIKTTPSCSGHHFSEKNFEQIYDNLEKDEKAIRNEGLDLKDIETGKEYVYKNRKFKLPWGRKNFIKEAAAYQQKGILGIRPGNRKKLKQQLLSLNIPGTVISEKDSVVFFQINGDTNGENRETWKRITAEIESLFK